MLNVMFGSSIINQRQHVGLQKLSALSAITTQFIGPTKNCKFIQDDATGESTVVSSCHRVLENLELTCAVGQLVYETAETHQRVYKTGTGCLLFMAGAWSRAALECLHLGIPIGQILAAMSEGLDICSSVCEQCRIAFEDLHPTPKACDTHLSNKAVEMDPASDPILFNHKTKRKLKLSRHFHESEFENKTLPTHANSEKSKFADIARTLSHGCSDAMDLVVKASQIQLDQDLTFDIAKISTCLLPGACEEHVCVIPGCIVQVSPEQAVIAYHLQGQDLKVALIHGDLRSTFRHLGYNKPKGLLHVSDCLSSGSENEQWLESVMRLLLNLDVCIVLISGVADMKLKDHFWKQKLLLVEKVKLSVLKTFATSTSAIVVSYATQLNPKCIGRGVNVNILKDFGNKSNIRAALNVSTVKTNGLVTVVLTSCVEGKLQSVEDTFWACAYRLHWALQDKYLLPGAGVTEMICIHKLQKQANMYSRTAPQMNPRTAASRDTGVVLQLMADGLMDFITSFMANTGRYSKVYAKTVVTEKLHDMDGSVNCAKFSQSFLDDDPEHGQCSERTVCDNLVVKQETWRKALDLVFLVLQTDAEVITGVGQKRSEQSNLVFL